MGLFLLWISWNWGCVMTASGLALTRIPIKAGNMTQNDKIPKKRNPATPDVVKEFTDSLGRTLVLKAEFKMFNDRVDIAAITIQTTDPRFPLTRRMLTEIPLDTLFRNELATEAKQLNRILRNRKGTTSHQGRAHSEEDLQEVADIYRAAFQARVPIQQAVADGLGISVSTAAKRIMAARRQGFITPTQRKDK